jgi:hypothetical protein
MALSISHPKHAARHFHWFVGVVALVGIGAIIMSTPMLKPQSAQAQFGGFNLGNIFLFDLFGQGCSGSGRSYDPSLSSIDVDGQGMSILMNTELAKQTVVNNKAVYAEVVLMDCTNISTGGRIEFFSFRKSSPFVRMGLKITVDDIVVVNIDDINDAATIGQAPLGWSFSETAVSTNIPILFNKSFKIVAIPKPYELGGTYEEHLNNIRVGSYVSLEKMTYLEKYMRETNMAELPMRFLKYNGSSYVTPDPNTDPFYVKYAPGYVPQTYSYINNIPYVYVWNSPTVYCANCAGP